MARRMLLLIQLVAITPPKLEDGTVKNLMTLLALSALTLSSTASALSFSSSTSNVLLHAGTGNMYSNGEVVNFIQVFDNTTYEVIVSAGGLAGDGIFPLMALRADYATAGTLTVNTNYWADYRYTVALAPGVHRIALAYLNDSYSATGDRNLYTNTITIRPVGAGSDPVRVTESAWLPAIAAQEDAIIAATDAAIDANRKSAATVRVVDAQGNPVTGAQVSVNQTSHDFLFGANYMSYQAFDTPAKNALYEQRFADLFNYATAPFFWKWFESVQGQPNYAYLDSLVNSLVARGILVKGHPLLWDAPDQLPTWTNGNPTAAQMGDRMTALMGRYEGLVTSWEVVNEPTIYPRIDIAAPYQFARSLSPNATLIVNDYGQFVDGENRQFTLLQNAKAAGVPFDAIGFQAHDQVEMAFPLAQVQEVLNKYATLGKDLHITEFTPPSSGIPVTGATWRGTWTEAAQAAYAEDFYRVAFANPAVTAISWWDFTDKNSWVAGGGLLRADLSAKPAYDTLKYLITQEWHTALNGATSNGNLDFSGFHGKYTATVTVNGTTTQANFRVAKGGNNVITVVVNATGTPTPPADTTAPVLTRSGAASVTVPVKTTYTDAGATATDNVDGNISNKITVSGTVNTNVVGTYTLTYNVTDAAGNAAAPLTRTVIVQDSTVPVITMLGSASVSIKRGRTYTDAGATATDNYDGTITNKITKSSTVNTSKVGTYSVTYNVKDAAGNAAATRTRTVKVTL